MDTFAETVDSASAGVLPCVRIFSALGFLSHLMTAQPTNEELRLLVKVARFYYEEGLNQDAITARLGLSRSKVSRLMAQAREAGVVQITVVAPEDLFLDVESRLEERYGLQEALVVEVQPGDSQSQVSRAVGGAAAGFMTRSMSSRSTIGMCWGDTLRHMAVNLTPQRYPNAQVVQMIGGIGQPDAEVHATELCRSMARSLGCRLTLLPVPGIVADQRTREALLSDVHVQRAVEAFDDLDIAFVGIGAPTPDSVTMRDGSIITRTELDGLLRKGAVGDIALRYYDAKGECIESEINDRIIGMSLEQIKQVPKVVGISGGPDKVSAIRAALRGEIVNVLITDSVTAEALLESDHG
jgi:DNA-binding transcriptional regulator LsrR (DeoR family)